MFQRLMQDWLGKLKLIYYIIYLDDIIMFSWTAEEHLHGLHVVFNQFHEYNLKLKLSFQGRDKLLATLTVEARHLA